MKSEVLKLLRDSSEYISGEELCSRFQVSRTAVWKVIKGLRSEGYEIEAVTGRGYRLKETPDILSSSELESVISTKWLGRNLVYLPTTDSTNTQAKLLAEQGAPHGTLVAADMQTGGRGRRGRTWIQKSGENISMSLLIRPEIKPDNASMLTLVSAASIKRAIEELAGTRVEIKWPNDLIINGKKICGILTEMSAEQDYIHYVVPGFGINVSGTSFPEDIKSFASSIYRETGKRISRSLLIAGILKELEKDYESFILEENLAFIKDEYNSCLVSLGREVRVLDPKGEFNGISRGITDMGELIVECEDGRQCLVSSGEVSVRGLYGYV